MKNDRKSESDRAEDRKAILLVLVAAVLAVAAILAPSLLPRFGILPQRSDFRVVETPPGIEQAGFRSIKWSELLPADWNPASGTAAIDLAGLSDGDPRATKALQKLREIWDRAPLRADINGTSVRIPGYVIPLERQDDKMVEFLLVPYFGACIHTPPPPANQVIHGVTDKPLAGFRTMDAAWVSGEIEASRSTTGFGNAGYRMKVSRVEPYKDISR